jgi:cyanophycin synthetase
VRLIEIRVLEGPNVYRLEPTIKVEVAVGRRRTWFGQRVPERHATILLGATVSARRAPRPVAELAAWVRRLHAVTGAAAWTRVEPDPSGRTRRGLAIGIHQGSDPGHWIVAFPWRERGRAEAIAEASWRLVERGLDPRTTALRGSRAGTRSLQRAVARVREGDTRPPSWLRDADRRVPVVSISGTNGKTTTTRMITHILRTAGRHVGTTTSDGVLVDGRLVEAGDWSGPGGARQILSRGDVDVGVLETARGGILLRGLGYETNEASVLTNVSSDHLDLQGIHTVPELAEVKSVIARMTKPDGTVVLNADDPLVAALARTVRAPVCFFSLDPRAARVRRHLERGGKAMLLDDGWIVEAEGDQRHRLLDAADAPATLHGIARHNVANALAAAGAARALGASRDDVTEGLRTYRPSAELAPGRLNVFRLGERVVIVDFAHNEAGVSAVLDVAEAIAGGSAGRARPITAIIGTAGDRPDDTLRGIGRIAAQRADRVAIKETLHYLRGRTREWVAGEILVGVTQGGKRRADVAIYESETKALRAIMAEPQPGVAVLMCHEERDEVFDLLREAGARPIDSDDGLLELLPRVRDRGRNRR